MRSRGRQACGSQAPSGPPPVLRSPQQGLSLARSSESEQASAHGPLLPGLRQAPQTVSLSVEPQGSPCLPLRPLHWPLSPPGDKKVDPGHSHEPPAASSCPARQYTHTRTHTHTEHTQDNTSSGVSPAQVPSGRALSRLTRTSLEDAFRCPPASPSGRAAPAAGVRKCAACRAGGQTVCSRLAVQSGCWPLCLRGSAGAQAGSRITATSLLPWKHVCLGVVAAVWTPARRTKSWGHAGRALTGLGVSRMLEGVLRGARNPASCQFCFLRSLNFLLLCKCMNGLALGSVSKSQRRYTQAGWDGRDPRAGFLPQAPSQDLFRCGPRTFPSQGSRAQA